MKTIRKNKKEDIKLLIDLGEHYHGEDLTLTFTAGSYGYDKYVCSYIGGEAVNCVVDGSTVLCLLDNHRLPLGTLSVEIDIRVPDTQMPDGDFRHVTRKAAAFSIGGEECTVELTNGSSDYFPEELVPEAVINLLPTVIKGDPGQDADIEGCNAAIAAANQLAADVAEAETAREQAEKKRTEAEAARAQAETERTENETARQHNETLRSQAEDKRISRETDRQTSESVRTANEKERTANETKRLSAEAARAQAENGRTEAEAEREQAETNRSHAEQLRHNAEEERKAAEQLRIDKENNREDEERKRYNAENQRQQNETERQSAEQLRQQAETRREQNEASRANAETSRNIEETKRQNAENDRIAAETTRQQAETVRQDDETKRQNAEAVRIENNKACVTATEQAVSATEAANTAANTATEAAKNIVELTTRAEATIAKSDKAANDAAAAVTTANQALTAANDATKAANTATGNATTAAQSANDAADRANKAADLVYNGPDENVSVACYTNVEGASTAGLVLNVYINENTIPQQYTTDENGLTAFKVTKGLRYDIVFPDIEGCSPIGRMSFTAALQTRGIEVTYQPLQKTQQEHVTISFRRYEENATWQGGTAYPDGVAHVTIDGVETTYHADSNGMADFFVDLGKEYTVSIEKPADLHLTNGVYQATYTADRAARFIPVSFHLYLSDILIVDSDGGEWTYDGFINSGKDPSVGVLLHIATEELLAAGCDFFLSVNMMAYRKFDTDNKEIRTMQWAEKNVNFTSIPLNGNSPVKDYYYDGFTATNLIVQEGLSRGIETPCHTRTLRETFALGVSTLQGYTPAYGQYSILIANHTYINDIVTYLRPDGDVVSKFWGISKGTSTQQEAMAAFEVTKYFDQRFKINSDFAPFCAYAKPTL